MKTCTFSDGVAQGGTKAYIDTTNTDVACGSIVMNKKPYARAASWSPLTQRCYAIFGDHIVTSVMSTFLNWITWQPNDKTCLFRAGRMSAMNLGLIFQQILLQIRWVSIYKILMLICNFILLYWGIYSMEPDLRI